jgi:hypothetical protein
MLSVGLIVALFVLGCGGPSEPQTFAHSQASFKITIPAGWSKISEDSEMYEFRDGDLKLIEVGGFDMELSEEDFEGVSDEEFMDLLEESTLDGLEGYCDEAEIPNYTINSQGHTTWGGIPAYRLQAQGYSNAAEEEMIVDLLASINKGNGFMYMFASQIAENMYNKAKADLENAIMSFTLME